LHRYRKLALKTGAACDGIFAIRVSSCLKRAEEAADCYVCMGAEYKGSGTGGQFGWTMRNFETCFGENILLGASQSILVGLKVREQ
jgi:hypothetical protein